MPYCESCDYSPHYSEDDDHYWTDVDDSYNSFRLRDRNAQDPNTFTESPKLKEYLQDGIFCDVSVRVEDKTYKLHRVILYLKSKYFQKLFTGNFIECNRTEVELKTVDVPIFDCIVKYMYENDLQSSITSENMTKLLIALDYLQIEVNLEWFSRFIGDSKSIQEIHLFELFDFLAFHSSYPWLLTELLRHFSKNLFKVSQCEYFNTIPFEYLKKILLYNEIINQDPDERRHIAKISSKWICYDINNRFPKIVQLVNAVKYRYSDIFFVINGNLDISCTDCDDKEKYVRQKIGELLDYSVEFIPDSWSDWFNIRCEDSLVAPKNTVNLKQQMQELLHSGDLNDITIKIGNKIFPLHRIVLASKSTYFYNLFMQNDARNLKEIEIEEADEQTFALILNHIYFEEMEITSKENIVSLMIASDRFELSEIHDCFSEYIKEKIDDIPNIFELFSYLQKSSHNSLFDYVEKYILDNWSKITYMPNFANLSVEVMKAILSLPNVFAQEETDIIKVCTNWITHDYPNRLQCIPSLISSISRTAVNMTSDVNINCVENDSPEVTVQNHLNRLLKTFSPVSVIEPEWNSPCKFEKPFFIGSSGNQIRFFKCIDFKSLIEMNELQQTLPYPATTLSSACAAVAKDNLFVRFNGCRFYAQNLHTKRCVSLTSDALKTSFASKEFLLSCNENVFLCQSGSGQVTKFSTHLNRWLLLPDAGPPAIPNSTIFTSNGKMLYSISAKSRTKIDIKFYDERTKFWQTSTELDGFDATFDRLSCACFTNEKNLLLSCGSYTKILNLRNMKWTTLDRSREQSCFSVKSYKSHIFFLDRCSICSYNIYNKNWDREYRDLISNVNDAQNLIFLNVVHSI